MKPLFNRLIILIVAIIAAVSANALTGKWRGELSIGPTKLPLVFNFTENSEGITGATMDSPLQNALGIPLEVKYCSGDSLSVACSMIGATYTAKISDSLINGTFSQQGYRFPLTLTPEDDIMTRRPQTPRPPFPYTETDTVFTSADGTRLAGTLVVPIITDKKKKFPMVVMVTGSGPQNRDEEIFEHRPFAVIADALARNGIASLRYDDRGTAKSEGKYSEATLETFTGDAKSAFEFARELPFTSKTGILGHSEGGTIAVLLAADQIPDFIISL
ncbi:MAG: CocE/NonD family hydrolase, partial [Paramuribaculum sp.]|nr:CocE/NonD family hydrolase [Paramuribaculum sp.]